MEFSERAKNKTWKIASMLANGQISSRYLRYSPSHLPHGISALYVVRFLPNVYLKSLLSLFLSHFFSKTQLALKYTKSKNVSRGKETVRTNLFNAFLLIWKNRNMLNPPKN